MAHPYGQQPGTPPGGYPGQPGQPGQPPAGMYGMPPGGYPGMPGGYPGAPGGYPGAPGGYPGAPGGFPGAPGGYPGAPGGYPGAPGGYPGAPGGYPGAPGGYPGAPGGYPGQPGQPPAGMYGMAPGGYPGAPGGFPGAPGGYPGAPGTAAGQYPQPGSAAAGGSGKVGNKAGKDKKDKKAGKDKKDKKKGGAATGPSGSPYSQIQQPGSSYGQMPHPGMGGHPGMMGGQPGGMMGGQPGGMMGGQPGGMMGGQPGGMMGGQPGGSAGPMGGPPIWPVVSTPAQFKWRFEGENYPESKESRTSWCPNKPGYQTDLVTCEEIGTIKVWNSDYGQVAKTLAAPDCQFLAGIKSGDTEILAAGGMIFTSSSTTVHLFNLTTGAPIHRFEKLAGLSITMESMSFLPSTGAGELTLAGVANESSSNSTIRLFDMATGMQVRTVPTGTGYGGYVRADPDNPGMLFFQKMHADGKVHLFDTRVSSTSGPVRSFLGLRTDDYYLARFDRMTTSGTGAAQMVSCHQNDVLKVWDVGTARALVTFTAKVHADEFQYGGITENCLVAARCDRQGHVWALSTATDDAPSNFSLVNSQMTRNNPPVWTACMNGKGMYLCSTVGVLDCYWGPAPVRAW